MRFQISLAVLLAMALVLAGCLSAEDGPAGGSDDEPEDEPGDGSGDDPERTATIESFTADPLDGTAPLNVTFDWDVETNDENATWALDFGDGGSESGDVADSEDPFVHSYGAGNFTATFTVTYGESKTVEKSVNVTIEEAAGTPDQLVFEYGPSLGCAGDFAVCISAALGPDEPAIDGHWQDLDESYWGLDFTVTSGLPEYEDTDCTAYDADQEPIGADLNGGPGPCEGPLPEGTKWLFLYSYAVPTPSLTLEFSA